MLKGFAILCYIFGGGIIPVPVMAYENIALKKPTWQSHRATALLLSADLAVDGQKSNLSYGGGECTFSAYGESTAEWRVDLGNVLSIHHVLIQVATNNREWDEFNFFTSSFLGFSVYISNTNNKEDGVLCFRDTNYTRATVPNSVIIPCPYHGRYVIYYNNRTHKPFPNGYSDYANIDLCEVEVYGCEHQGHYGENCSTSCPANCLGGLCHISNGTCIGCSVGYKGEVCDEGMYNVTETPITGNQQINNSVTMIVLTTAAAVIAIIVFGTMCKRMQMFTREGGVNLAHLQDFEMETDVLTNRASSSLIDVYPVSNVNDRRVVLPATIQQNERQLQEEVSVRLEYSQDSHSTSVENAFTINKYQVKFTSDIQMQELQTFIGVHGDGFKGEFALLPVGERHACCVGKREENLSRNRYKTILPYDHSRVILNMEDTDYINANYIKDNDGKIAYIATQGPNNNTINDFWRMIWQENVTQIVMLTNLMEEGKIKCNQYWPESSSEELYGDFNINKNEEISVAFYVIRIFTISHRKESRVVTQYHYIKWPDHGTPDPLSLVVFHSHVLRTRSDDHESPTIVHCSAGIGRTGTYIAFDALCKEGKSKGTINVANYVKVMRSCRMNMVQTYEQYKTIYLALSEEFKASVHIKSISAFEESMKHFSGEKSSDQFIFQREFKTLLDIKPAYTEGDFRHATSHALDTEEVLPLDKYNLYLTSTVPNRGNYMNAVYVSSFLEENAFIVTQYPSEDGAVDFLRMLIDNDSDTVIFMDPRDEIESSTIWLPELSLYKLVGPYSLQHEGGSEIDVKVTSVKILNGTEPIHSIKIVQPTGPLKSIQATACLRSLVSYVMNLPTQNPVTIVSEDGTSLCGVFCAVFNCIQQINMDDSVDVFTTVRQLQTRRPEFCSTLEEYMLVYKSVKDFIEFTSEHVYSNQ